MKRKSLIITTLIMLFCTAMACADNCNKIENTRGEVVAIECANILYPVSLPEHVPCKLSEYAEGTLIRCKDSFYKAFELFRTTQDGRLYLINKFPPLLSMPNSSKVIVEPYVGENSKIFNFDYEPSDKLVDYLKRLTGVTNVFREDKYALIIYIGKVFSWNDLEPKIVQALQSSSQ